MIAKCFVYIIPSNLLKYFVALAAGENIAGEQRGFIFIKDGYLLLRENTRLFYMHMKDKVVFVTGGASGIGRQTALDFAEHGAKVVIFDLVDAGASVVEEITSNGGEAIFTQGNIAKQDEV